MRWFWLFWSLSALLSAAALALLYFSLLHDRARGRRRCPRCWYDMGATPGLTCPECGKKARRERSLIRTRRRYGLALLGLVLAACAWTCLDVPRAMARGHWWTAFPRPVQIVCMLAYDDNEDSILRWLMQRADRMTGLERALIALHCDTLLRTGASPTAAGSLTGTGPDLSLPLGALESLGHDAWPAEHGLIALAADRTSEYRRQAIRIIAKLDSARERCLPLLANLMRDSAVSGTAVDALCSVGRDAAPQRGNILLFLTSHTDVGNLLKTARLIRTIDGDAKVVEVYRTMLACPEPGARLAGAISCAKVGCADTIPDILGAIRGDPPIGGRGAEALGGFGLCARPVILGLLSDPDPSIVAGAIRALARACPADAAIIAQRADDPDPQVSRAALESLWDLGRETRELIPHLRQRISALRDSDAAAERRRLRRDEDSFLER